MLPRCCQSHKPAQARAANGPPRVLESLSAVCQVPSGFGGGERLPAKDGSFSRCMNFQKRTCICACSHNSIHIYICVCVLQCPQSLAAMLVSFGMWTISLSLNLIGPIQKGHELKNLG